MPNIKSAIKRVEVARKNALRNAPVRSAIKTAVRKFEEAVKEANIEEAKTLLTKAFKTIDMAASKGVIHKNMASRKKSRLAQKLNKIAK